MPAEGSLRTSLREGDTIGVVAPGFAVRRDAARAGIAWLRKQGHPVLEGPSLFAREGYLAGTDGQRADDLNRMLRDPQVRCIWFARGGYGMARILPLLDWDALRSRRRLFIGYSDATALFARLATDGLARCIHGPMVAELGDPKAFHAPSLLQALRGEPVEIPFSRARVLRHGRASGRLVGGNLTVLAHLLGTPFAPTLAGAILAIEEVGEEVYRIDRLLTHLAAAGMLAGLAAVVVGKLVVPKPRRRFPPDRRLREVLAEKLAGLGVPVATDLPFGHVPRKRSLPLGGTAEFDTRERAPDPLRGGGVRTRLSAAARRVRLDLAYDGTDFSGWQVQPRSRTVQGVVESVLTTIQGDGAVPVRGAGRTDSGVHAHGQVADAWIATRLPDERLLASLNGLLPMDVRVRSLVTVADNFHARHDAVSKTYRYLLDRSEAGDPFLSRYAVHHPFEVDDAAVRDALWRLRGRRDWSAFSGAACEVEDRVRDLTEAVFETHADGTASFRFSADGFLTHMVRNLVGTLLEVARGRIVPRRIEEILEAGDRRLAGPTAPARGLCLLRVAYASGGGQE